MYSLAGVLVDVQGPLAEEMMRNCLLQVGLLPDLSQYCISVQSCWCLCGCAGPVGRGDDALRYGAGQVGLLLQPQYCID